MTARIFYANASDFTNHHHPDPDMEPLVPDEREFDDDLPAATAGEQDHTDPWMYAGEDADPPEAA